MEQDYQNIQKSPDNIDFQTLRVLLQKYPWFSYLHMLWLVKSYKDRTDIFNTELRKHVIYLRDRKKLYQLLNEKEWPGLINPSSADSGNLSAEITPENDHETELLDFHYRAGQHNLHPGENEPVKNDISENDSVTRE